MGNPGQAYSSYPGVISLPSRHFLSQPSTFGDVLASFDNSLTDRLMFSAHQHPGIASSLCSTPGFPIATTSASFGVRPLVPIGSMPPPGSFQHLLASMTNSAIKVRDTGSETPVPCFPTLPMSGPGLWDVDRRSSSIAALRLKAREHEIKLGAVPRCNSVVY